MPIDYRILGALEVTRDGETVTVSAPKERVLLLSLLLRPNAVVAVDELVEALWDARAPSSAAKLVQLYVSNLRKLLGADSITTSAPGYRLDLGTDALDSHRFSRLLTEGRDARASGRDRLAATLFERGLSLWRGPRRSPMRSTPSSRPTRHVAWRSSGSRAWRSSWQQGSPSASTTKCSWSSPG